MQDPKGKNKWGISNFIEVTSGIPQGSVIGPLLFLVYVNDLPINIKSSIRLFADDCILYRRIRNNEDREIMQRDLIFVEMFRGFPFSWFRDLILIEEWVANNRMSRYIAFSNKRSPYCHSYCLNGKIIKNSDHCKYLGVTFDRNLNWEKQINLIVAKAYKMLHYVMRNLRGSSRKAKEKGYLSLVRPIVEYATTVWDPYHCGQVKKIEKIQRKAARYVMGKFRKRDSVTEMLDTLRWDSLEKRRKISRLGCIYNIITSKDGWVPFKNSIVKPNFCGKDSHEFKIKPRRQRTDIKKYSFLNRGISEWNKLPVSLLRPLPKNVISFKKKCSKIL